MTNYYEKSYFAASCLFFWLQMMQSESKIHFVFLECFLYINISPMNSFSELSQSSPNVNFFFVQPNIASNSKQLIKYIFIGCGAVHN